MLVYTNNCHVCVLLKHHAGINLIDKGGNTPLILAARWGSPKCLEVLLDHHADVNLMDKNGNTPLFLAAGWGRVECLGVLLTASGIKIKVDQKNRSGQAALHNACKYGHSQCARVLLNHGADVNLMDKDGCTPLFLAAGFGWVECLKVVLNAPGIGLNKRAMFDTALDTALHTACRFGHRECVEQLLSRKKELTEVVGLLEADPRHSRSLDRVMRVLRR